MTPWKSRKIANCLYTLELCSEVKHFVSLTRLIIRHSLITKWILLVTWHMTRRRQIIIILEEVLCIRSVNLQVGSYCVVREELFDHGKGELIDFFIGMCLKTFDFIQT